MGLSCNNIQLHIFTDASEMTFGAVAYVRVEYAKDVVVTSLVIAKSRLAPLKRSEVPRLELQGAVIGVRSSEHILKEIDLPIASVTFWTDSTTVFQYVCNGTKIFQTFVANRV